jgi:hypothetical protein
LIHQQQRNGEGLIKWDADALQQIQAAVDHCAGRPAAAGKEVHHGEKGRQPSQQKWSFADAVLFCFTVITTIGWVAISSFLTYFWNF